MAVRRELLSAKKVGLSPGTVLFTGERRVEKAKITIMRYHEGALSEEVIEDPSDLTKPSSESGQITWINVDGLHDTELVSALGLTFGIHPLALEDVVSVGARPQVADYGDHLFTSVRMLAWTDEQAVSDEHISLVLGPNWLLTFQERPGDVFGAVRDRLRRGATRIRSRSADYLWYALLDAVVDHYILVVGELAGSAELLEEQVWHDGGGRDLPEGVQAVRREALVVRRAVRPVREEVDQILRDPAELISEETTVFLRDLKEHLLELSDSLEIIREMLSAVMDAHLSLTSMRANDVMKVLTIVATIFIPITFIAGVYGMNFEQMPELSVWWAYPAVWLIMLGTVGVMLGFFRRKGWL